MPIFGKRKKQLSTKEIAVVVQQFITAVTWERCGEVIKANKEVLLSDRAVQFLQNQVEAFEGMPFTQNQLKEHLNFLQNCRKSGVETATKNKITSSGNSKRSEEQEISKFVTKLILTSNESDSRKVIKENPELLDPVVDSYLSYMIRVAESDNRSQEMISRVKNFQSALRVIRSEKFS